jgi:hypothetical protein
LAPPFIWHVLLTQAYFVMAPLAHESGQDPQLNPQPLVPHARPSLVHDVASQPEHWPALHVAVAELIVQSKQSLPARPHRFASAFPG